MARRFRDAVTATSALAALIIAVGATGTAVAATGGTFILGKSNSATTLTTLSNTKGTALSLKAPSGSPALAVSNTNKVARLNADLLDGLNSSQLQRRVSGTCAGVLAIQGIGTGGGATCSKNQLAMFTADGSYVVPAGVHKLYVRAQAGGSGGGGGAAAASGGGGGSGNELEVLIDVTPGETLGVTVGTGGPGGAAGQAGTSGTGSGINRGVNAVFVTLSGDHGTAAFNPGTCFAGGGGAGNQAASSLPADPGVLTLGGEDGVYGGNGTCGAGAFGGQGGHHGFAGGGGKGGDENAAGEAGLPGYVLIEVVG